ncbi:hypothetical protein KZC56_17540 [Microbacterium sp. SSW1-47]|uniref:hypothetical protein n=1 Tax=Microbacterium sufflavum TaxID=2851649 RepID=UPI001FFC7184|nr:hypothetical protein [Microbacterium sufflavum]MCK2028104.1 hypothetical protein [Microbacterium sufflavum]
MTVLRILCLFGIHPRRGFAFVGDGWNDIWIRVCRECGRQMYGREAERAYARLDAERRAESEHE